MSNAAETAPAVPEPMIRHAETRDHADVRRLYFLVHAAHAAQMPDIFRQPAGADYSLEEFEACLGGANLLLIAERGGAVVGLLHALWYCHDGDFGFQPCSGIQIWNVVTEPAARRTGVARALIAAAAEWAAERKLERIDLNVWAFNTEALALYRSLGFTVAHTGMTLRTAEMLAHHGTGRLPPHVLAPASRLPEWLRRLLSRLVRFE